MASVKLAHVIVAIVYELPFICNNETLLIQSKYCMSCCSRVSLAARGGNLAKIPPNQVIDDFGRGSSIESESE